MANVVSGYSIGPAIMSDIPGPLDLLHEELGRGRTGIMCRARNYETGELVAGKVAKVGTENALSLVGETKIYQRLTRRGLSNATCIQSLLSADTNVASL